METSAIDEKTPSSRTELSIFNRLETTEHEQVLFCSEPSVGLKAIIAIHDTTLGPALGGVRMWPYESEKEALEDVLRLSRGMTYKAAISGLNLGGGKSVIMADPRHDKNEALFRAFGRFVEGLGGRYITAEDVGIEVQDMEWVLSETKYVTGISKSFGGSGDPSPVTAYGVYMGMKACALHAYGRDSLTGKRVAIQGAGHVATHLARYLSRENADLIISDIYEDKVTELAKEVGADVVPAEDIYDVEADIFSPCALGGIINDDTIPRLHCDIVAGCANNVLEQEEKHAAMLMDRDIIYAPDYVINAGGLINVFNELEGYDKDRAHKQASRIYDAIRDILNYSDENDVLTYIASNELAEQRICQVSKLKNIYASTSHFSGRLGEMYMRDRI